MALNASGAAACNRCAKSASVVPILCLPSSGEPSIECMAAFTELFGLFSPDFTNGSGPLAATGAGP